MTTEAALTKLSPGSVFTTSVVAVGAPDNGVVDGDLWLVGGGDPLLMTEPYAQHFFDQPITHTSLETLADSVVKAGVHEVRGGVVGDDSRYDRLRAVPQWPARFSTQGDVVGPLSALMVNDGLTQFPPTFRAQTPPATPAADPAEEAANQFAQLLSARGVQIDAAPSSGVAPSGASPVAKIDSVPLDQVIGGMLRESDNTAAELLTKDLGLQVANTPSTAAGVQVIDQTLQDEGLPMDGTTQVDGSGLAPEDRVTCGLLQSVLDKEGPDSTFARSLPVAGQSGTLTLRFRGTPGRRAASREDRHVEPGDRARRVRPGGARHAAELRLRHQPAAVADRDGRGPGARGRARHDPVPVPTGTGHVGARPAGGLMELPMFPLGTVLFPSLFLPLHVFEPRYREMTRICMEGDREFGVVLIERGSEVGGNDVRTSVGTIARIVEAEELDDGRWVLATVGTRRFLVNDWMVDDPYPRADIEEWLDDTPSRDLGADYDAVRTRLRRVLALTSELAEPAADATIELSDDPTLGSYQAAAISPLGPADHQRLLASPGPDDRLRQLDALLTDEEELLRARLRME